MGRGLPQPRVSCRTSLEPVCLSDWDMQVAEEVAAGVLLVEPVAGVAVRHMEDPAAEVHQMETVAWRKWERMYLQGVKV